MNKESAVRILSLLLLLSVSSSITHAQTVTYRLGADRSVLDEAFYAGDVADGSNVAGRRVNHFVPSPDGKLIAVDALNSSTRQAAIFIVDVGDPSSWYRLTNDGPRAVGYPYWTPDQSHLIWASRRVNLETGEVEHSYPLFGNVHPVRSITTLESDNWIAGVAQSGNGQWNIELVPVLRDGSEDGSREPIFVTNMIANQFSPGFSSTTISSSGTQLTVSWWEDQPLPAPTFSDVYLLGDLPSIMNAPRIKGTNISSLAPVNLADPAWTDIRASETDNFVHSMRFSQDESLVFVVEDFNNVFNNNDYFNTIGAGDWDPVVCRVDGSAMDFRIDSPGSTGSLMPFQGGTRLLQLRVIADTYKLYSASLEISTTIPGLQIGPLADNVIQTTSDLTISDASGTEIFIHSGTFIDFPDMAARAISISTPVFTASETYLPDGAPDFSLPVLRDFGPDGTTFDPAIEVTISYTDAEISGMDERALAVHLYNTTTGIFDIPIIEENILERDTNNNRITFLIDHFSTFGIGDVRASSGGGGGCLIATATSGTPLADDLRNIRSFRNKHLLNNPIGTMVSDAYYRLSPWVSHAMTRHPRLKAPVRVALTPTFLLVRYGGILSVLTFAILFLTRVCRSKGRHD
jgi:hypothetical protein